MKKERLSWEDYFMCQAILLASRSTCDRASVGTVLVKDKRIIATGYNGSVNGESHCDDKGHLMVDNHCIRTVHSEVNAVTQCARFGVETENAEVYVTHFPCLNCTKTLIQAGVSKINYLHDYRVDEYALQLLEQTDIKLNKIVLEKETQLTDILN